MVGKIQSLANVAILLVAGLIGLQAYRRAATNVATPSELKPGTHLTLAGVDWHDHARTLLLVLSPQCHFCSESAPLYRRLTEDPVLAKHFHFIAVLPSRVDESRRYLNALHVTIGEIRQFDFASWRVPGTPTLILVDSDGKVVRSWVGKLNADSEEALIADLSRSSNSQSLNSADF
jgi:hypothetical protein